MCSFWNETLVILFHGEHVAFGEVQRVSHSRVSQTAAKPVVCCDGPGSPCSVYCHHEKLSTPTFYSCHKCAKKALEIPQASQHHPHDVP